MEEELGKERLAGKDSLQVLLYSNICTQCCRCLFTWRYFELRNKVFIVVVPVKTSEAWYKEHGWLWDQAHMGAVLCEAVAVCQVPSWPLLCTNSLNSRRLWFLMIEFTFAAHPHPVCMAPLYPLMVIIKFYIMLSIYIVMAWNHYSQSSNRTCSSLSLHQGCLFIFNSWLSFHQVFLPLRPFLNSSPDVTACV